jgi:predicted short-subunit dehydrogenase-like oxidoreductase (DUF2520 family)
MKFGFIGCGNVSCSLSSYLFKNGATISGFKGRSKKNALSAAKNVEARVFDSYEELLAQSDIVFIATPDDVIQQVGEEICNILPKEAIEDKIFCHLSGVHSSDILKSLLERGATIASLHPLASVSSKHFDFRNTYSTLDAQGPRLVPFCKTISLYNLQFTQITASDKTLYHAAACILSNYTVTLFQTAQEIFTSIHMDPALIHPMLLSLLKSSVENIEKQGAEAALTGPISRGDVNTIKKHLKKLKSFPQIDCIYRTLGEKTIQNAYQSNRIDQRQKQQLMEAIKNDKDNYTYDPEQKKCR